MYVIMYIAWMYDVYQESSTMTCFVVHKETYIIIHDIVFGHFLKLWRSNLIVSRQHKSVIASCIASCMSLQAVVVYVCE
jgi:hypothetical protein